MAIPVIYQGDDTDFRGAAALSVNIDTDFDLDGCTVTLWFQGCRRDFTGLSGRTAVLPLAFSASETGRMPVGTHKAQVTVFDSAGRKRTASDGVKIRVTDDLREAYSGEDEQEIDVSVEVGIDPTRLMEGETLKTNTPNSMRQAIKKIAKALGATVSVLAMSVLPVLGASVQTAQLGDLDLDQNPSVVTNVDLSGLLTEHQDIGGKADKTNTYTKAEADAKIVELAPAPGNYATVSNRAMSALQSHQSLWPAVQASTNYTDAALGAFAETGTVERARSYGTPTRWMDATGCVWEVTADKAPWTGGPSSPLLWSDEQGGWLSDPSTDLLTWSSGTWQLASGTLTTTFTCSGEWGAMHLVLHSGDDGTVILERGLLTNFVGRVALTNDLTGVVSMDVLKTTDESKLLNAPSLQSARVVPNPVQSAYWPNRQRVLKLGDSETVVSADRAEADWLLVRDPSRLLFVDTVTINGSETNYTFKTFQQYLNAVSPDTMQDIMRAYLPVEGGGSVTGNVDITGNLLVRGTFEAPNLVRVVTADIEANGFSVSNGVLRANSGLVVSNGMCKINCARATIGIGTPRLHIEGSVVNATRNLTFGGDWDAPYFTFYGLMTNQVDILIRNYGLIDVSNATAIAAMPVVVPDYRTAGSRRIVVLENWRLNLVGDSLYGATMVLRCPNAGTVNTRFDVLLDFSSAVPYIILDAGTWGESPVFLGQTDALEPSAGTPRIVHFRCLGGDRWIVTYDDLTSWMPTTNVQEEEEP